MTIKSMKMESIYHAVDEILDYMEHCLDMSHPPATVPVPFKLIKKLHNAVNWEPSPKPED